MTIRKYIQILMLGLVVLGTALDSVYVGSKFNIEIKMDLEKDSESSEKENQDKKDSKYLETYLAIQFSGSGDLIANFTTKTPTFHSFINEELIPPEVL